MKKGIPVLGLSICLLLAAAPMDALAQKSMAKKRSAPAGKAVIKREGDRLLVARNGGWAPLMHDTTLPNGIMVLKNGKVLENSRLIFKLLKGERLTAEGKLVDARKGEMPAQGLVEPTDIQATPPAYKRD